MVGALLGCSRSAEVRYRVTLTVDDHGEERRGSSVWSQSLSEPTIALASTYDGQFAGEAVTVVLSGGRALFATLRGGEGGESMAGLLPEVAFGDIGRSLSGQPPKFSPDRIADLRDIASREGEMTTLNCAKYPDRCPMLVTFADESDPASVRKVDPARLSEEFGPGVFLKAITVEITDDPVTTGIEQRLTWLKTHRGTLVERPRQLPIGQMPLAHRLNKTDFRFTSR